MNFKLKDSDSSSRTGNRKLNGGLRLLTAEASRNGIVHCRTRMDSNEVIVALQVEGAEDDVHPLPESQG